MISRRLLPLFVPIIAILLLYWVLYHPIPTRYNTPYQGYKSCTPRTKVAFLKTHKCASSSLQNILMRFGLKHQLNFVLPGAGNYLGRYVKYGRNMIANTPWEQVGMEYQVFCLHTIWNYEAVNQTLGADTTYITIIRDPVELFESLWVYAGMDHYYQTDLETFATAPKTGKYANRAFKNLGRNQMLWDAGLSAKDMDNLSAVKNKIEEIDKTFDLVLMAERFDESMILLKEKLCWDYRDVINFKLNARKESKKTSLSDEARDALKEYLAADYLLYNHFKTKFESLVAQFGPTHMSQEVSVLRHANQNMQSRCAIQPADNDKVYGPNKLWGQGMVAYTANEAADSQCRLFSMSEMSFIDELREIQSERALNIGNKMNIDVASVGEQINNQMNRLPLGRNGLPSIEMMKSLYIHT